MDLSRNVLLVLVMDDLMDQRKDLMMDDLMDQRKGLMMDWLMVGLMVS